jgi:hypothetical protein
MKLIVLVLCLACSELYYSSMSKLYNTQLVWPSLLSMYCLAYITKSLRACVRVKAG